MWKKILPSLIIFTAVIVLYYPVLTTFFSQDDFFHFKVSLTDGSIKGFFNLFGFYSFAEREIAFYRPISREIPFNLYYLVFGLNSPPFRILIFLLHFLNIFLVYTFVWKVFNKRNLAYFVSFFFAITAANVATLYYLAGGLQTLLATTFTLASLIFFHKVLKENKLLFKILTFITFLLGISSHEQAMIIPFLLTGLIFIFKPAREIKNFILILLPYYLITIALLYMEIFKIGFSSTEQQYQAVFNIKTIVNSLFWYSNWALGTPETLIDFVLPGFKLNPTLLRYWSNYYIFIFPSFFVSTILIALAFMYLLVKKRIQFINKKFLYLLLWYPLSLLPVLLLPLHKSTHYLAISLLPFWTIVGLLMFNFYTEFKKKNIFLSKLIFSIFITSLIILSSASAIMGSTTYWASQRGKIAQKLIRDIKKDYPALPKGAVLYFQNDPTYPVLTPEWGNSSKQASTILNGSDALQLLYQDPTIEAYYEDIRKPASFDGVFSIMARIY